MDEKKSLSWTNKGKKDLFETFAVELQEYYESDKMPGSCDREMQYWLELQNERLQGKDLSMKYHFAPRDIPDNMKREPILSYADDKYKTKAFCRPCRFEGKFYRGTKQIYSYKEKRNLFQSITFRKNPEVGENEEYICPNCGAGTTIKGLLDGCDYCQTRFKMDELFPKVTGFYMLKDFTGSKKDLAWEILRIVLPTILVCFLISAYFECFVNGNGLFPGALIALLQGSIIGLVIGYLLWCVYKVGSVLVTGAESADMLVGASGSKQKFEKQMKKYSPEFSYAFFTNKVISMLRVLLYAKDVKEIPFYAGESVGDLFEDIADAHFRGSMGLKKFEVKDNYCYVTVDAYMDVIYAKTGIRKKEVTYRMELRKDISVPMDMNFSIARIHCPNCNTSFDATRRCDCPACGTRYEVTDDWVVLSVKKK